MHRWSTIVLTAAACGPPRPDLPDRPGGSHAGGTAEEVEVSPRLDAGVARVPRVRVGASIARGLDPGGVWLFTDELSEYHERRVRSGDLPSTLVAREVPARVWLAPDGALQLAPLRVLEPGRRYSVGARGVGTLGGFPIDPDAPAPLELLWPPSAGDLEVRVGGARWVYCGAAGPVAAAPVLLEPGAIAAEVVGGLAGPSAPADDCLTIVLDAAALEGTELLAPVEVLGMGLEPLLVAGVEAPPASVGACGEGDSAAARGCVRAEDDRVVLFSGEPALWVVESPGGVVRLALGAGERAVARGWSPASRAEVRFAALDIAGDWRETTLGLEFGAPRARVVVNEVLANALGAEPSQEWVELVNDGAAPVDLAGWSLEDVGGVALLPAHVLAPGAFALVVPEGYDAAAPFDIAPAPGTPLLVVPKLGKSGLSNAGEPLLLRDAAGAVVSRFPAREADTAGTSQARGAPWLLDDDPAAFGPHAAPGASPGAPNVLASVDD
ncbi:MAG: lamin tail domain-containing protein [Polyangiaceae bacterium]|nr:lamin tail domain-containing protein [Polyangiaceae bacterium]